MSTCTVPQCSRPARALGLCKAHHERQRRGRPIDTPIMERLPAGAQQRCCVPLCSRPARALGLCNAHYKRHRRGSPIDAPVVDRIPGGTKPRCSVPFCSRPGVCRYGEERICTSHERRIKRGMPDWRERPMTPIRFRSPQMRRGETAEVRVVLPLDQVRLLDVVAEARGLARATAAREAIEAWLRAARPDGRIQRDELEDSTAWARRALEMEESC